MFKIFLIPLLFIYLSSLCGGEITFQIGQPSTSLFYGTFQGFGAEWDPFFWDSNNQNRGCNQAGWTLITNRIKETKMGILRMMMQLNWATSTPDLTTWNYNSTTMQSVFKYLDFCQENNIDVILTDWGYSVWQMYSGNPADIRYARGMAMYLKEFINNRGYTCIKYFIVGNEPDNEIVRWYGMDAYVTMYNNVHNELISQGIRNKIKLTAPDMGGQWSFFEDAIDRLHTIVDTYDHHRYASYEETSNTGIVNFWDTLYDHINRWRTQVQNRDPQGSGKMIFITEMGMGGGTTSSHPEIDTYKYAIHMADYGTTLLTTRNNAGNAWTMHDVYYFGGNQFMQWGMMRYANYNWALRPWSQTWSLLIRFAPRGSIQAPVNNIPLENPPISPYRCAAVKRPDNGWSIFLVNRTDTSETITVILPETPSRPFIKYFVDSNTFNNYPDNIIVPPAGSEPAQKEITLNLGPNSFTVLSENTQEESWTGPLLAVDKDIIDFSEVKIGQKASITFKIMNLGTGTLTGTVTDDKDWIGVLPESFEGNSIDVTVTVDNDVLKMREGDWTGLITVNSNGGKEEILVKLKATCVIVQPNPYKPDEGLLKFSGSGVIPFSTTVKIFSLSGEKIKELHEKEGKKEIFWDGKNIEGNKVKSGVYFYTYETPVEKGTGKFTVIKGGKK